jgi:hypothetical protein
MFFGTLLCLFPYWSIAYFTLYLYIDRYSRKHRRSNHWDTGTASCLPSVECLFDTCTTSITSSCLVFTKARKSTPNINKHVLPMDILWNRQMYSVRFQYSEDMQSFLIPLFSLYTGSQSGPEPPIEICLVQASFIYAENPT